MEKFNPVETWISNVAYSHSESKKTAKSYRRGLKVFCDFIGKTPEQILREYDATYERTFRRKYSMYIKALVAAMQKQDYACNSIHVLIAAIKSFMKYNDLPLGYIPASKRRVKYHNRDITKEEILNLLKVARTRDRAFFVMMVQSGLRPQILCKLQLKNLQPDFSKRHIPCCVRVPEELSKGQFGSYFTFLGEEAVEALKIYFTTRSGINENSYLFVGHGDKGPLSPKSFSAVFSRLARRLRKTGVLNFEGKVGKPAELRLYNFRKYFRKYAGLAGIEYVNFWMGHKTDYQAKHIPSSDMHYFPKEDIEFHRKVYDERATPHLRLGTTASSETDLVAKRLEAQIAERDKRIRGLEEQMAEIQKLDQETMKAIEKLKHVYQHGIKELEMELENERTRVSNLSKIIQPLLRKQMRKLGQKVGKEMKQMQTESKQSDK